MTRLSNASSRRLGRILSLVFVIAVVMGAGPGLYLVNPDPSDPETKVSWLGVPIVYAWVTIWFLVQAGVVLLAYFFVWNAPMKKGTGPICRNGPKRASRELDLSPSSQTENDR